MQDEPASRRCQDFLDQDTSASSISDFSLHSLGVLLFRRGRVELFRQSIADTLPELTILGLSASAYSELIVAQQKFNLDFDDSYQFCVARENGLAIATQDKDFNRIKSEIEVLFI